jgi:hypothetical protein
LKADIADFTAQIKTLNAEIAQARVELQRATEDKIADAKEFQQTIKDQQETQRILDKAMNRLDKFYNAQNAAFLQASNKAVAAKKGASFLQQGPPPGLEEGG